MTAANLLNNALNISKLLVRTVLSPGDRVVDATLGNGHDTIFLAECVGEDGHVYAFDVQKKALETAEENIPCALRPRIQLFNHSHEHLHEYIVESVKLVLFNLGYLPGATRDVVTQAETTLSAIKSALQILASHGVIILVVYRGHEEGIREWEDVVSFTATLDQKEYNVMVADFPNQKNNPPALISIQKRV